MNASLHVKMVKRWSKKNSVISMLDTSRRWATGWSLGRPPQVVVGVRNGTNAAAHAYRNFCKMQLETRFFWNSFPKFAQPRLSRCHFWHFLTQSQKFWLSIFKIFPALRFRYPHATKWKSIWFLAHLHMRPHLASENDRQVRNWLSCRLLGADFSRLYK